MSKTVRYIRQKNVFSNIDEPVKVELFVSGTFIGTGSTDDHIGVFVDNKLKKTINFDYGNILLTSGDGLRAGSIHSLKFAIMTGSDAGGRTQVTTPNAVTSKMFVKMNPIIVDAAGTGRFTSISGAIDFVKTLADPTAGHTISVKDGTYPVYQNRELDLVNCDNLKIIGRDRAASRVIISGSNPAPTNLIVASNSSSFAFMTLKNSALSAINCFSGSVEHTVFVEAVIIERTADPIIRSAPQSELRRTVIKNCDYGLRNYGAAKCSHLIIHDINTLTAPSNGSAANSYGMRALSGSIIQNCTIHNVTGSYAIDAPGGTVVNCIVSTCKVSDYGIKAASYKRNLVHNLSS